VAEQPFRSVTDLARVRTFEPDVDTPYVIETVRILAADLKVPLLAFAGAPFTVASYLIEGRPSRTYEHTKALMHTDEHTWHELMGRLADHAIASIRSQLDAGASAFQLFDSWAGALSRLDYERFAQPHSARVFGELRSSHPDAVGIHFGIGCDHILESMYAAGPQVIGLDWRTRITDSRARLGPDTVVQGNLDPALVLAGWSVAQRGCDEVLHDNAGHPGHIFNLGHGVQPNTDPDVLAHIVEYVHVVTQTGDA
jgi:uroporphyrinogen decarboxylase